MPVSLLKQALEVLPPSARMFNTYSISETHDVCTIDLTDLPLDGMDTCPVGLPMDGVKIRVRPEGRFCPGCKRCRRIAHRWSGTGPRLSQETRPGCR